MILPGPYGTVLSCSGDTWTLASGSYPFLMIISCPKDPTLPERSYFALVIQRCPVYLPWRSYPTLAISFLTIVPCQTIVPWDDYASYKLCPILTILKCPEDLILLWRSYLICTVIPYNLYPDLVDGSASVRTIRQLVPTIHSPTEWNGWSVWGGEGRGPQAALSLSLSVMIRGRKSGRFSRYIKPRVAVLWLMDWLMPIRQQDGGRTLITGGGGRES